MMRSNLDWRVSFAVLYFALVLIGGIDQMTKDALKVKHLLKTIETHPARSDNKALIAEVSEKELNAYITYRLSQEKNPLVNSLTVELLDANQVGGRMRLDAEGLTLGALLCENLDFDFKGILHTREGAARLDLSTLQLCGLPVKPQLLDFALSTIAQYYETESSRIGDWYEMPKGIKQIIVQKGRAVIYY